MVTIRRAVAAVLVLGLLVSLPTHVCASFAHTSHVASRYFKVVDDGNSYTDIAASWRWWLRAYHAIKANPKLARKLTSRPVDMSGPYWLFINGNRKTPKLGLTQSQIELQPSHVYTLHIASYQKQSSLISFVKESWLRKHMEKRKVYKNVSKDLRLSASGEFDFKDDPLYSQQELVRGQKVTRLCYGVYASVLDANRDRRVLERQLGLRLRVQRGYPTAEFVGRVWCRSVMERREFANWELDEEIRQNRLRHRHHS